MPETAGSRGRRILILEDDSSIGRLEVSALTKVGHEVTLTSTGAEFFAAFNRARPDLVILDLMLPDTSGEAVLKAIRQEPANNAIPVVIVSAKNLLSDRIANLDMGADDYIEKPFDILEFLARINARLRNIKDDPLVQVAGFTLNEPAHRITYRDQELKLTSSEYTLLAHLIKRAGTAVSRSELVQVLWGPDRALETRTIDIHMNNIRRKIDDTQGQIIKTIYGVGYLLERES